jgi:PAS domain S-box-containing protein
MSEEPVRVLVVDDEPGLAELVALRLERESDRLDAAAVTSAPEALSLIDADFGPVVDRELPAVEEPPWTDGVDCVVSDYDMPRMDGLSFLDAVRAVEPDLPFVLYTGKGSEELASEAISRGVTDYLQKGNSPDRYARLANRAEHAVARRRAERALETERRLFDAALDRLADVFYVFGEDGRLVEWNDRLVEVTGYDGTELEGMTLGELVAPADRDRIDPLGAHGDATRRTVEARLRTSEGETVPYEFHAVEFTTSDGRTRAHVGVGRDVGDRRALEARTERLVQFAATVAHDVQSTLNVAQGRLSMLADEVPPAAAREHLDPARRAVDRVGNVVADAAEMAESGDLGELRPTRLASVADAAWEGVDARGTDATLRVEESMELRADRSMLRLLLANLFHNTVEHAGDDVEVRVGALADGFYVADDGPGVPESDRERVFDWRFSTDADGSGIGLASVRRIVELHDWTVAVDESDSGGARVVVRGVEAVRC